ncbi:MAG TPA: hypothetical protein DDW65_18520 [Firmicutes bacterium]|jgi:hypothetical protein|nr:hypothetical protein [Bacillota bacterium]
MSNQPNDKKYRILAELGEESEREALVQTMGKLERYTVPAPPAHSTDELIAFLKPILQEGASTAPEDVKTMPTSLEVNATERRKLLSILRLVQPQAMLISRWFVLVSVLVFMAGLAITKAVHGNMLKFLANASPLLGILTVFYEFRARLSGTTELEAACPYSPAQLAVARLLVVLSYDTLLCLAATPFVSYWQDQMLWQVAISWFAPLLLVLGIALTVSLRFGIMGGCLVAATVWILQLAVSERGSMTAMILPKQLAAFGDFITMGVGIVLLFYVYRHWKSNSVLSDEQQND